jgi:hypothetical protein
MVWTKWDELRRFGESTIVRRAYVWFFLVPAAAKLLQAVGARELGIFGSGVVARLDLPFSWIILFWASAAFAAGSAIYSLRCPPMVRAYADYDEYKRKNGGIAYLIDMVRWLCAGRRSRFSGSVFQEVGHALDLSPEVLRSLSDSVGAGSGRKVTEESCGPGVRVLASELLRLESEGGVSRPEISNAFHSLRGQASRVRPVSRHLCAGFFLMGLGCVLYIVVQNIAAVIAVM